MKGKKVFNKGAAVIISKYKNLLYLWRKLRIVFHNGSNYDYHFIKIELAEEFKEQFTCLRESTEKYITFTVPIGKELTRIDKDEEEITKHISYKKQFINSARFSGRLIIKSS